MEKNGRRGTIPKPFLPVAATPSEARWVSFCPSGPKNRPPVDLVEGNCCGCGLENGVPPKNWWWTAIFLLKWPPGSLEYVLFYSVYVRWKSHTTSKLITGSSTCATVLLGIWRQRRDVSCVDIYSTLPIPKASSEGLAGSIPKGQVNLYVVVVHPIYCMFVRYS